MRIVRLIIIFHLFAVLHVTAQTDPEKAAKRMERLRNVDYTHVGIGVETGGNKNWFVGPKVFYGIGSYRNTLNADIGISYLLTNPLGSNSNERIMLQQLPVFANLHLNIVRWPKGCMYIGGEVSYHLCVGSSHVLPAFDITEADAQIGRHYLSLAPCIGVRTDRLDIGAFCEYRFSPAVNQKYIFESQEYDYDVLHDSVFERFWVGLSVSYLLPF